MRMGRDKCVMSHKIKKPILSLNWAFSSCEQQIYSATLLGLGEDRRGMCDEVVSVCLLYFFGSVWRVTLFSNDQCSVAFFTKCHSQCWARSEWKEQIVKCGFEFVDGDAGFAVHHIHIVVRFCESEWVYCGL